VVLQPSVVRLQKGRTSGTHALRHTYRTWLDSVGTPMGVQQRLMRHTDVRLTMGVYGEAATPDMVEAHGKIVRLAMNGRENGRENVLNH
jgi:integrase